MEEGIKLYQEAGVAIKNASGILLNQQERYKKARQHFSELLKQIETEGMNEDLYVLVTREIKRYNATKKSFNAERTPVTSVLMNLAKPFIDLENDFDSKKEGSMASILKAKADAYASLRAKEEAERQEKLRKQAAYHKELDHVRIRAEAFIRKMLTKAYEAQINQIDELINKITIENSEEIRQTILTLDTETPKSLFANFDIEITTIHVTDAEKNEIVFSLQNSSRFNELKKEYEAKVVTYQQQANLKIPAIVEELKELEAVRVKNEQEAKKIEATIERRREISDQAKHENLEKEKKLIEQEAQEQEVVSELQVEFDFSSSANLEKTTIKKKVSYEIDLVLPGGVADIFRFWLNEYAPKDLEKAKRWTIDRMIKFAEKAATKENKKIVSEYVIYNEKVQAKI